MSGCGQMCGQLDRNRLCAEGQQAPAIRHMPGQLFWLAGGRGNLPACRTQPSGQMLPDITQAKNENMGLRAHLTGAATGPQACANFVC